jgi:predicted phage tail protein
MGAIWQIRKFRGAKGGSSSRTPTEQPDDLQSVAKAKILLALGEGEFSGGLTGQSIFLDGTPLLNADGSSNFSGVTWEFRAGTQAQTYIQGMPGSENEISLAVLLFPAQRLDPNTYESPAFCRSPAPQMAVHFPAGR